MPPPFTVAALAVAEGPADAVGVVQLACEPDALALTLLKAGAYRHGFVPGTLAEAVTVHVPYSAVRGLVRRGKALVLSLDRSVPTPFHRFALARFTEDPAETLAPIHRAHRAASTLAWALPGPIGALAAALPSSELAGGALGRASMALLVALVTGAAMRAVAAWLAWGGPVSDRHREAFETAISERLGLVAVAPKRNVLAVPRAATLPQTATFPQAGPLSQTATLQDTGTLPNTGALRRTGTLPQTATLPPPAPPPPRMRIAAPAEIDATPAEAPGVAWGKMIALAAVVGAGAVAALVVVKRYGETTPPVGPPPDESVALSRVEPPPKPPPPPSPPPPDRCFCERAQSSLWKDGIPVLTVMTTTGADGTFTPPAPKLDEHDQPMFSYDVAVVNNGAKAIDETRIVLTYARRDAQDRRVAVTDRGLYWGKPLAPGAAVKWTTEGPGTEVRIDPSETGTLDDRGLAPAPADAFFALLRKKHRVVRIHAAMMLAYLHDPRVPEALDAVGAPLAPEVPLVKRIRAAGQPVIACDVTAADGQLRACLFNSSTKPGASLTLREVEDSDSDSKEPRSWPVPMEIPVHDGVQVTWPLEGDPPSDLTLTETP